MKMIACRLKGKLMLMLLFKNVRWIEQKLRNAEEVLRNECFKLTDDEAKRKKEKKERKKEKS
jgi:ribosomal protein S6